MPWYWSDELPNRISRRQWRAQQRLHRPIQRAQVPWPFVHQQYLGTVQFPPPPPHLVDPRYGHFLPRRFGAVQKKSDYNFWDIKKKKKKQQQQQVPLFIRSIGAQLQPVSVQQAMPAQLQPVSVQQAMPAQLQPVSVQQAMPAQLQPVSVQQAMPAQLQPVSVQQTMPTQLQPVSVQQEQPTQQQATVWQNTMPILLNQTLPVQQQQHQQQMQTVPNQQQQQQIQLQPPVQPAVQQQTLPMNVQVPTAQFESFLVQMPQAPPPVLQPQQGQPAQQTDDMFRLIGENEEAAPGILSTSGRSGGGGGGGVNVLDPSMLTRRPTPCPNILRGNGTRNGGRSGGGGGGGRGGQGGQGRPNVVGNRHLARSPPPPPPPPGLTRTELTQIFPVVEVDETIAEEICTICQEHLVATSLEATVTPCGHYFHFDCARGWFRRVGRCPNCHADILLLYATTL
ncbi:hypothetical protein niasHT_021265 [Heterodera trifolii]|uniref:RING-type domain-containing protein n=1 Tax=Heterodera trifolii TaxID=157864 RepID=A0ABD2JNC9_9BILA